MSHKSTARRWRLCGWIGAAVLVIAGSIAPTAAAEPEPGPVLETGPDTAAIAQEKGITVGEAIKRYGWHTLFSQAATAAEEGLPDSYAESRVTGPYSVSVTFAGQIPAGAADYFKSLPEHVDVELIGGAPYPRKELIADMQEIHLKAARDPDVAQVFGSVDATRGEIELDVQPKSTSKSAQTELRGSLTKYASASGSRIPVKVTFSQGAVIKLNEPARGGSYIDELLTNSGCTTAFPVKNSSNQVGLLTADHCSVNPQKDLRNPNSSVETRVVRLGRKPGGSFVDLAWYSRGTFTASNQFYTNYNTYRAVVNASNPAVNTLTYRFGRITGNQGSYTIDQKDTCFAVGTANQKCRASAANRSASSPGDSGGPWFLNGTAHGVHTGQVFTSGKPVRDLFTVIYALNATLGLGLYYG